MKLHTFLVRALSLAAVLLAVGCQDPEANNGVTDTGFDATADIVEVDAADAGDADDGGPDDADDAGDSDDADGATADADTTGDADDADVSDADAGPDYPLEGFGALSGECDVLDDELTSEQPGYFENVIDFGDDPYDESDKPLLTMGGMEIIDDGNAGGNSLYSEVFAYEVLYRCEMANLLETETEITYQDPQGKITDLLVQIDGLKIGVSVTRAVAFPFDDPYTVQQATDLLTDKLSDVKLSTENVAPEDVWEKQILHVIAYAPGHEDSIETAFGQIDAQTKADTILWVTVSNGSDDFLY